MASVKCSRCDRNYSGMRLKCPYCGAHRSKRTVRKEQEEMSNSKFVIGGIVLLALIAAVVILIIISLNGNSSKPATDDTKDEPSEYTQDEGIDSVDGTIEDEEGTTPEDSTPPENPVIMEDKVINSVSITLYGDEKTDVTVYVGDTYDFEFETDPETTDEIATWSSDDSSVAVVLPNGEVTAVGEGSTFINCTVGNKTGSMLIRVKG